MLVRVLYFSSPHYIFIFHFLLLLYVVLFLSHGRTFCCLHVDLFLGVGVNNFVLFSPISTHTTSILMVYIKEDR